MEKKLNVLTIGNSFADSAVRAIVPLAEYASKPLNIFKANFGGCELRRHWSYIAAEIANPADCRIYSYGPLSKILKETPWDIVTIQQASHESWRPETFHPYAENICNFVKVCHYNCWVGNALRKDNLCVLVNELFDVLCRVIGIKKSRFNTVFFECYGEKIISSAVYRRGSYHVIAARSDMKDSEEVCGLT